MMKQDDVDEALNAAVSGTGITHCGGAKLVHRWLSELIEKPGTSWLQRQVLRTVRGYVTDYLKHC